jgi:hypothetical protein
MASRMRCIMCHAVRQHTPYFRSISRAATPFFEDTSSKIVRHQIRSGIFVPCIIVPVMTENCLRQVLFVQRHTRR